MANVRFTLTLEDAAIITKTLEVESMTLHLYADQLDAGKRKELAMLDVAKKRFSRQLGQQRKNLELQNRLIDKDKKRYWYEEEGKTILKRKIK